MASLFPVDFKMYMRAPLMKQHFVLFKPMSREEVAYLNLQL